jgi:hypothetical protein
MNSGDHLDLLLALEALRKTEAVIPDSRLCRATFEVGDVTVKAVWFPIEVEPVVTVEVRR